MYKLTVVIEGRVFDCNTKNCGGCEWLTSGSAGWFCDYDEEPTACEYPEVILKKHKINITRQDDGQLKF